MILCRHPEQSQRECKSNLRRPTFIIVAQDASERIAEIVSNTSLASSIAGSIATALGHPSNSVRVGATPWEVFKHSLDAAIRNIETHRLGNLFRRLVEYGPQPFGEPEVLVSDQETVLSDPELGQCIEFIYSHMVNRFKGEMAELLALEACCSLVDRLYYERKLPRETKLFWGESVQERRYRPKAVKSGECHWGGFTKGADGILIRPTSWDGDQGQRGVLVHGVIEVKSMVRSQRKVIDQIDRHVERLAGGLRLGETEWSPQNVRIADPGFVRVIVQPSSWKLSREYRVEKLEGQELRRAIFSQGSDPKILTYPEPTPPTNAFQITEADSGLWKIDLAWSREALAHAAFEMTFWYMGEVGKQIYTNESISSWFPRTPKEIGMNLIKQILREASLRPLPYRQYKRAVWLYNIYCYGYQLGAGTKEMLFLTGEGGDLSF